jgi:hypothetical protein
LKLGGTLEHRMQIGADPGFEASGGNGWRHGLVLLLKLDGKLPYIATPLPYDFYRSVS